MLKTCSLCEEIFWARWRNTPDICDDCLRGSRAVVCPECLQARVVCDPAQLALPGIEAARPLALYVEPGAAYSRPPRSAPRPVQLKNPYQ